MVTDMSGLQLHPYENAGSGGEDGLDAFRPAAFLNDISTLLEGEKDDTDLNVAELSQSTSKTPKKRKSSISPASPKKSRSITMASRTKKSHLVPSSPGSNGLSAASDSTNVLTAADPSSHVDEKKTANPADANAIRTIAQAAVNALIDNVDKSKEKRPNDNVDTSTAHIKALTGNNWVYASTAIANAAPATAVSVSFNKTGQTNASRGVRRQPLTADERASQNRDRNREHARNTRLRKKAYVDELKRTLIELVAQRDEAEQERRRLEQMEKEQKEVRFRVIEEFLKLRGSNEANVARWSAILDEKFTLALPVTRYRKMVPSAPDFEQKLLGVSDCMADASNLLAFLRNFHESAMLQYKCDREGFVMDGTVGILEWEASVTGTDHVYKGNFRGTFCPSSNKLVAAKMMFDTGAIHANERPCMKRNVSMADIDRAHVEEDTCSDADAILSSIGIPRVVAPSNLSGNVVAPSVGSSSVSEKDDVSSTDGSLSCSVAEKQDT